VPGKGPAGHSPTNQVGPDSTPRWVPFQCRSPGYLVRIIATHVLTNSKVTPEQLYGLCKLTWITDSYEGNNPGYVTSTKIPALSSALSKDYEGWTLSDVSEDVASVLNSDEVEPLIRKPFRIYQFLQTLPKKLPRMDQTTPRPDCKTISTRPHTYDGRRRAQHCPNR
jgi:hypothetical protein